MPRRAESLALTDNYQAQLLDTRQKVAALAASHWLALSLRDLDRTFGEWRTKVAAVVRSAKTLGVQRTDAYFAAFIGSELGVTPRAQGVGATAYMNTVDGRSLTQALTPPLFTVKIALAQGRHDALHFGLARATRIAAEEAMDAPRRALGDLIASDDRVKGWERVTSGNACGACLAEADGRVHKPTDPFDRHSHCRCIREPVVRGVPQQFKRPTGREIFDALSPAGQAALFHGRGGAEKADLVRSGAVPFDALVRRERQEVTPDQFTEQSLDALRALAHGRA